MRHSSHDRIARSRVIGSVRLTTGPRPSRANLEAACTAAAQDHPKINALAVFSAKAGASQGAAMRVRATA